MYLSCTAAGKDVQEEEFSTYSTGRSDESEQQGGCIAALGRAPLAVMSAIILPFYRGTTAQVSQEYR